MKLTFNGQSAMAAATIIAGTSLRNLVSENGPIRSTDVDGVMEIDERWRWSSGELHLTALLYDISTHGNPIARLYSMEHIEDRCDSETVRVCREAVALLDAA